MPDNNAVENAIRPLKLGSKNWLFLGSYCGGVTAARFYTIIRACVLNGVEPEAYLREVLACIGEFPTPLQAVRGALTCGQRRSARGRR